MNESVKKLAHSVVITFCHISSHSLKCIVWAQGDGVETSLERSLKVTEAIITGCLQPAENTARDDHKQAATVAGNMSKEEIQARLDSLQIHQI